MSSIKASLLFLLLSVVSFTIINGDDGHCIWYGECYFDGFHHKNCPYTGPAKALDSEGQKLLYKYCPYMMNDQRKGIQTCCDTDQLVKLDNSMKIAANLLSNCPNCFDNLVKHFCEFTCSPQQSSFINVTKIETTNDATYVNEIDIYITNKYLEGTYTSCSKVSVPSTGQLAPDLMCGPWGASGCTAVNWFHFMGDATNNFYVPFQVNYIPTDNNVGNFTPMDPVVTPCSEPLNSTSSACSCVDCEESCPVTSPAPSPPQVVKVVREKEDNLFFFQRAFP